MKYQSSRTRIGQSNFNNIKVRVDSDGFSKAVEIAVTRGILTPHEIPAVKARFYKRLAQSMRREMENELADGLLKKGPVQLEYESLVYFLPKRVLSFPLCIDWMDVHLLSLMKNV